MVHSVFGGDVYSLPHEDVQSGMCKCTHLRLDGPLQGGPTEVVGFPYLCDMPR